ncbi:beta-d-glucosyl crocetin beta-1 6-glucosyltransferase, partial [Phtheirospermum japonicum]
MDTRERSIRVLMFPWLAHGHISPFLELAKSLSKRNFITYICSSPINLNPIKKTLSPKHSISIKLVELQIPTTPHLPPHYHTTNGLPPHLMGPLKRALDSARPVFSSILETLNPDLVLYDFLQPWAPEEAALKNIPAAVFFSTGAAASSLLLHHSFRAPGSEYPFPGIYFRVLSSGTNDHVRVRECVERSSDVVLMKTFRELEGKYIDFLSDLTHKKIVPVGALV